MEERCVETAEIGGSKPSSSANTRVAQPGQSVSPTPRGPQVRILASGTTSISRGWPSPDNGACVGNRRARVRIPLPLPNRPAAAGVVVAQRLSARLWPESCRFDSDRSLQQHDLGCANGPLPNPARKAALRWALLIAPRGEREACPLDSIGPTGRELDLRRAAASHAEGWEFESPPIHQGAVV